MIQENGKKPAVVIHWDGKAVNPAIEFDPEQIPTRWFGVLTILEGARIAARGMMEMERIAVLQKEAMQAAQAEAIRKQIIG